MTARLQLRKSYTDPKRSRPRCEHRSARRSSSTNKWAIRSRSGGTVRFAGSRRKNRRNERFAQRSAVGRGWRHERKSIRSAASGHDSYKILERCCVVRISLGDDWLWRGDRRHFAARRQHRAQRSGHRRHDLWRNTACCRGATLWFSTRSRPPLGVCGEPRQTAEKPAFLTRFRRFRRACTIDLFVPRRVLPPDRSHRAAPHEARVQLQCLHA